MRLVYVVAGLAQLFDYTSDLIVCKQLVGAEEPVRRVFGQLGFFFVGLSAVLAWMLLTDTFHKLLFRPDRRLIVSEDFQDTVPKHLPMDLRVKIGRRRHLLYSILVPLNLHVLYFSYIDPDAAVPRHKPYKFLHALKIVESGIESLPLCIITASVVLLPGSDTTRTELQLVSLGTSVISMAFGFTMYAKDQGHVRGPAGTLAMFVLAALDPTWAMFSIGGCIGIIATPASTQTGSTVASVAICFAVFTMVTNSRICARTCTLFWQEPSAKNMVMLCAAFLGTLAAIPAWLLEAGMFLPGAIYNFWQAPARYASLVMLTSVTLFFHPSFVAAREWPALVLSVLAIMATFCLHCAITAHLYSGLDKVVTKNTTKNAYIGLRPSDYVGKAHVYRYIDNARPKFSCSFASRLCSRCCSTRQRRQRREAAMVSRLRDAQQQLKTHILRGIEYRGSVHGPKGKCIVSFPGKYEAGWNGIVHKGHLNETSVACVFLPDSCDDAAMHSNGTKRWNHVDRCDAAGERRCYCHDLYGEAKPWGCVWFEMWCKNVEKAVQLKKVLVVYFFAGQNGRGKIKWKDCRRLSQLRDEIFASWPKDISGFTDRMKPAEEAAMWRKVEEQRGRPFNEEEKNTQVGLGGSQKAEVAWLDMRGYAYEEADVGELFQDELISTWQKEDEYHYNQLVPEVWRNDDTVQAVMDTGEGLLLLPQIFSGNARRFYEHRMVQSAVSKALEGVLLQLRTCSPEDEPAVVYRLLDDLLVCFARLKLQPQRVRHCWCVCSWTYRSTEPAPGAEAEARRLVNDLQEATAKVEVMNPISTALGVEGSGVIRGARPSPASIPAHPDVDAVHSVELLSVLRASAWILPAAPRPAAKAEAESPAQIDIVVSHSQMDSSWWKVVQLMRFLSLHEYVPVVVVSTLLLTLSVVPLGFIIQSQHGSMHWSLVCTPIVVAGVLLLLWPCLCLSVLPAQFGPWRWELKSKTVWLDAACVAGREQHNIQAVTQALGKATTTVVFFSANYLTQLRSVFELAIACKQQSDARSRSRQSRKGSWGADISSGSPPFLFLGLDWPSYMHRGMLEGEGAVELTSMERRRLEVFSCRKAMCDDPNSRAALLKAIREAWGSETVSVYYVAGLALRGQTHTC
jgi:hypothetical protein